MAHGSTIWATDGGAGLKDGTSLVNAAAIDPSDADDVWTIVNADVPAAGGTTVKLCADAPVTIISAVTLTRDGTKTNRFYMQGRNAADTTDTEVTLDANGAAIDVIYNNTAQWWIFTDIRAYNTDKAAGHDGFYIGGTADYCHFVRCTAEDVYYGFFESASSLYHTYYRCLAKNTANRGYNSYGYINNSVYIECIAKDVSLGYGWYKGYVLIRCIADNTGFDGFRECHFCYECVAYSCAYAFYGNALPPNTTLIDCVAQDNSQYAVYCAATGHLRAHRLASYNNTKGRLGGTLAQIDDIDGITGAADFFVNAAGGDFTPNATAGGGALLRGLARVFPEGEVTGYHDVGAVQHQDAGGQVVHMIG